MRNLCNKMLYPAIEFQSELLLYLDKRRYLLDIRKHCEDFVYQFDLLTSPRYPPIRYYIEIDTMDLLNFSNVLGKALIEEPLQFQRSCNKIFYACIKSIENENLESVKEAQAAVILRLKCVPRLLVNSDSRAYKGLNYIVGTLLDVSKPTPRVYHTVWSCPEECERNEVILHYIPKTPPKCYICRSVLFENSGLRRCSEQVTATFKIQTEIMPKKLNLTDDFIPQLKLGSVYYITTIILKTTTEVCSLETAVPFPAPATMMNPKDIDELYNACDGLPWKFIYCLASSIGVNVCPLQCFIQLKINLLLSLTSVRANSLTGSSIIHILANGFDTSIVGTLMEEGRKIADVSYTLGTSNTSFSAALIAATGGVCAMPLPLHTYNHKLTSSILSAIETGEITQESTREKLRTAVWAHGMDFKKINLYNIASVFATVCRGDHNEYEDEIAEFILQRAIEPVETTREEVQAIKDIRAYIDLISGLEVALDVPTEKLLRNYFLAARKEGTRGVTVGSMESLVATCLNSARLCRRTIATIDDAIFAIWLHVSGSPEPRFAPDEYLQTPGDVKKLQKIFNNFIIWLEEFTGSCYT